MTLKPLYIPVVLGQGIQMTGALMAKVWALSTG